MYVPNQYGKVQEKTPGSFKLRCCENNIETLRYFKMTSLFFKFFKNLYPFLCHFVTYNREYYQWFCRLRDHIQVGRLPVQSTWLGLVT